jgi:hypothetical protein
MRIGELGMRQNIALMFARSFSMGMGERTRATCAFMFLARH